MLQHRPLLAATALGLGLAALAPLTAASAAPAEATSATASSSVSADLTMYGDSTWYGSGQFVVHNDAAAPADWQLSFTVPAGEFVNHSDWSVAASVDGDRVTLTPKGGALAAGQSEYISFGISGDGSSALGPVGCSLGGGAVDGCEASDAAPTAPSDLFVTGVERDRAILNWTPGTDDDHVVGNLITLRDADGRLLRGYPTGGGAISSAIVHHLEPGTTYQLSMHAYDASHDSPESATVSFTTAG